MGLKFKKLLEKEQMHDRRKRKRELSKRNRKTNETGPGKAGYKKTNHQFNSIS